MFSLRKTTLCLFCVAISAAAVQLAAQDQQQEGPSRQQRQEQRRQRRQEAGAVRRDLHVSHRKVRTTNPAIPR